MLDFFRIVGTRKVHEVRRVLWNSFVITELLYLRNVVFEAYKFNIPVFDSAASEPHIHHAKHKRTDDESNITTVCELLHERSEVGKLNNKKSHKEQVNER